MIVEGFAMKLVIDGEADAGTTLTVAVWVAGAPAEPLTVRV
jgi:hypothetical protein